MKLSAFSDEISPSSARAIELANLWGLSHLEVRRLDNGRFPRVPDTDLTEFQQAITDKNLAISGVSPGLFKCPVSDPMVSEGMSEILPRACEWARKWGTDSVSCFAFRRDHESHRKQAEDVPAQVIDLLGQMCETAAATECRLLLENEASCWGGTGQQASEIVNSVGAQRLLLCWDPGNAARAGSTCPYPDEYETVRNSCTIGCVHMKNFDAASGCWRLLDAGDIDWAAHLRALSDDDFDNFLVVETHTDVATDQSIEANLSPLESNTYRNIEFTRRCL